MRDGDQFRCFALCRGQHPIELSDPAEVRDLGAGSVLWLHLPKDGLAPAVDSARALSGDAGMGSMLAYFDVLSAGRADVPPGVRVLHAPMLCWLGGRVNWPLVMEAKYIEIAAADAWLVTSGAGSRGAIAGRTGKAPARDPLVLRLQEDDPAVDDLAALLRASELSVGELLQQAMTAKWPDMTADAAGGPNAQDAANVLVFLAAGTLYGGTRVLERAFRNQESGFFSHLGDGAARWVGPQMTDTIEPIDANVFRRRVFELRGLMPTIVDSTQMLERPGVPADDAWFRSTLAGRHVTAGIHERMASTTNELARVTTEQRSALELLNSANSARQLELAGAQQERTDRLQRLVGYITALLLVPTLVATVLGAIPGIFQDASAARAALVVGATVVFGALSALGVARYNRRSNVPSATESADARAHIDAGRG